MDIYPSRYEEWVGLRNGRKVFLRPVKEPEGSNRDLFLKDLQKALQTEKAYDLLAVSA
jgi:hypothetical protein